jgi:hypothetical protein
MGPPRRIASRCLKWGRAGLFACADEAKDGFTLGLSPDGVEPFAPLLRLSALEPAKCAEGGAFAVCLSTWCDIKKTLPIDAMCAKGGGIADASDDRKAGEADAAGGTDPDDGSGTSAVSSKGCACRARGNTGSTGWHAVVLAVVVLARRAGRITTRNMSESQPGEARR